MAQPPRQDGEPQRRGPVKLLLGALVFPLFLAIALPGIYLFAFHEPAPHHMNVEIIGSGQQATQLATGLSAKLAPSFDVAAVSDTATARDHLETLSSRGAYDPATGKLYVASAGSPAAKQAVTTAFGAVAGQLDTPLTVEDIHPLPSGDRLGVSFLFLGLAGILAGIVTATTLNIAVPGLSLKAELGLIGLIGLIAGVITTFIAYSAYGALSTNSVAVGALVWVAVAVAGLVQSGGLKLIGPAMTVLSIFVLVILGIPASGIAIPVDMTPAFFEHLHPVLPTSAVLDGLRRVIYFGGRGIAGDIATLTLWLGFGGALIWASKLRKPKASAPADENVLLEVVV